MFVCVCMCELGHVHVCMNTFSFDMFKNVRTYIRTHTYIRRPSLCSVYISWFMCLFNRLPSESMLRVWDLVFFEGSKALFRYMYVFMVCVCIYIYIYMYIYIYIYIDCQARAC
jgi:hypothetical protein